MDQDPKLAAKLGPYLGEARLGLKRLEEAVRDRKVATSTALEAKRHQDRVAGRGLQWAQAFTALVRAALLDGLPVPPEAAHVRLMPRNPVGLATEIERLAKLGADHRAELGAEGVTAEMLKEGQELAQAVRDADKVQELERHSRHVEAVKKMRELMASVYRMVKKVNENARSVHIAEPSKRAAYDLRILHSDRGGGSGRSAQKPAAPGPSSAAGPSPRAEAS